MSKCKASSSVSVADTELLAGWVPGMLRWFDRCNDGQSVIDDATGVQPSCAGPPQSFIPFYISDSDGSTPDTPLVGYLRPEFASELARFPHVFSCCAASQGGPIAHVTLTPALAAASPQQRTAAIAGAMEALRGEGRIKGWRGELFPVVRSFHEQTLFLIERAAATHFGIKTYGVHLNGYVTQPDGSQHMWVARRSRTKQSWPGKLDNLAAGGQPHGLSVAANMLKEAEEEAGIPASLAQGARAVGAIGYAAIRPAGLKRDVLYCFDLELPLSFVPQPQDGEAEGFVLLPALEVARLSATTDEFKDNCNLVIADFLVRHGYLTPDMQGYCQMLSALRAADCT